MRNPPLEHVEHFGPNQMAIRHGDVTVLYSYDTPVAAALGNGVFVRTDKFHSNTTSRHIGKWLAGRSASKVPQQIIDRLIREGDSSIVTEEVEENPPDLQFITLRDTTGRASSLEITTEGLRVVGVLEHGVVIRPDTEEDRDMLLDWLEGI